MFTNGLSPEPRVFQKGRWMMALSYNPKTMATGVPSVDAQHQELFRRVGQLQEAMRQGRGRDEVGRLLEFLGGYIVEHFTEEEQWMERLNCPAAAENRRAHRELLAKFQEFRSAFQKGELGTTGLMQLYETLTDWLVRHVQGVDMRLRTAVSAGVA